MLAEQSFKLLSVPYFFCILMPKEAQNKLQQTVMVLNTKYLQYRV